MINKSQKLIFELGSELRRAFWLIDTQVKKNNIDTSLRRKQKALLPQVSESEIVRHFTALSKRAYGVDDGFYPLGSCTMKYNPKINEKIASLEGFASIHPTQPDESIQGTLEIIYSLEHDLCEITGMDAFTLQPAAGAHGEFTGLLLIKKYFDLKGESDRKNIIIPDSAHGTNPASAAMCGFNVITIPSLADGSVDIEKLRSAADKNTAALMLTNPGTNGLFESNITEIAEIIHEAGGKLYYDGANLNAITCIARPGDMGFDVVHLNLHKTFSTPHGGGGPGSGPVGCKKELAGFLPNPRVGYDKANNKYITSELEDSIGKVQSFNGNFAVCLRAYAYICTLGQKGLYDSSVNAVLNANYMRVLLSEKYEPAYDRICMHEFVLTLEKLKKDTSVSALDVAKCMIDRGIHPPTMYFPLIVHEALMFEPTETESIETIDYVCEVLSEIYDLACTDPEKVKASPRNMPVSRPDEVTAARTPIVKY